MPREHAKSLCLLVSRARFVLRALGGKALWYDLIQPSGDALVGKPVPKKMPILVMGVLGACWRIG